MIKNKNIFWEVDDKYNISSPIVRNLIFKKRLSLRKKFCKWIGNISEKYLNDIDWWLTIPSSRNPFLSDLFDSVCVLETLNVLLKKNYTVQVKTSSENLIKVLEKSNIYKKKNLKIIFFKKKKKLEIIMLLKTVIFYSIIFFYIKIFSKKKSLFNINQNILIESYSLLNFKNVENFNKNIFKFSNKNLLLVPNFLPEKKLHLIFNRINNIDDSKHIFRENYLSVNDFFYSLFHFFRKKKFIKKHKKFNQWDLTPLINGEIKSNKNFYSAILGISNFRFFANLKRKKIQLYKIISLFENQAVSRGWCCGSRTYFSKTENIGYQGYINFSQYLNSHPCNFEEKAKILPNKLAVISKYFKKNKREFFPKLKVTLAPALNLSTEYKKIKKRNKNLITLILTGIIEIDQKLINWSLNFVKKNKKTKLEIKFHPILAPDKFDLRIFNNNSNQIKIADKDISKLLDRSKIVISTGPTSAIYQAYLKECYLIIPVFDPWDKLNLENCKIPKSNYVLVNNFKEFRFNLKNMINNKDRNKLKFTKNNFIYNNCNSDNMKIFQ